MINLAENFARRETGPYALACQCRHLQEMRIPILKIAEELGVELGFVVKLVSVGEVGRAGLQGLRLDLGIGVGVELRLVAELGSVGGRPRWPPGPAP